MPKEKILVSAETPPAGVMVETDKGHLCINSGGKWVDEMFSEVDPQPTWWNKIVNN